MIKEDLRINNYYHSVKFNIPVQLQIEDFYDLCADCEGAELDEETIAIKYRPIKLAKEWLIRWGYEYHHGCYYHKNQDYFDIHFMESKGGFIFSFDNSMTELKYVHQLQDLLFALISKESILKTILNTKNVAMKKDEAIKMQLASTLSLLGAKKEIVELVRGIKSFGSVDQSIIDKLSNYNYDLTTLAKDRLANAFDK